MRTSTRRKIAEAALQESERLYRAVVESTMDAVVILSPDRSIISCNEAFCALFGYSMDEAIGKSTRIIHASEESFQRFGETAYEQVRKTGSYRGEWYFRRKEGPLFPAETVTSSINKKGPVDGYVAIIRDISNRKRAEEALRESEQRWQFALEGAGDGIWDWNAVTNEVFFSKQWKGMIGYEEHEIGNTLEEWDKRVHPEDKARVYEDIHRHFSGETPVYVNEHRILCKDGTYKWILDRGKVISWTEDGKPLRVVGTHADLTARRQMEERLTKANERMEMILHSLPQGIMIIDQKTHRIVDANPRACLMIGRPVHQIVGRLCHQFVCPAEAGKCPVSDLGEKIETAERVLLGDNGREVPILKTVLPLELEGNHYFIESFLDISEIKRAESERMEKETLQAVVETAGAVCHELNQPLMAISGYSELLQMELKDHHLHHLADSIRAQVVRMGKITQNLMRITTHKTRRYLQTKILDLNSAAEKPK